MKAFLVLIATLSMTVSSFSQNDLAFYCDVMNNAYEAEHRNRGLDKFNQLFKEALEGEESFNRSFEDLKWVSIKYPSDKSFRIITWQAKGGNEDYSYFGCIQMPNGKLHWLTDKSDMMTDAQFEQHDPSYWFGALYYNIIEREINKKPSYYLFGYNGAQRDVQIKVIEELHFENDMPVFGQESFIHNNDDSRDDQLHRVIIDYSDEANVNSNFNQGMKMIVHDYVTPRFGVSKTGRPVKIPDGTYVGYEWKENQWVRVEQIKHQISSPESIYYQPKKEDNKDLFGKPRKTKKN